MAKDPFNVPEAEFRNVAANFNTKVGAAPTAYGLTAAQATALTGLFTAFDAAYEAAIDPATRTKGKIATKNEKRALLKENLRLLARIIQANPAVTDEQRIDLGLNVRDPVPSPINPPTEPPVLEILSAAGRVLKVRLRPLGAETRGKPAGVQGASVFTHVGANPPADIADWKFEGSTSRTNFDVEFAPAVPAGSQVWLSAFWYNPRAQSGPACEPVCAYIAGGVMNAA